MPCNLFSAGGKLWKHPLAPIKYPCEDDTVKWNAPYGSPPARVFYLTLATHIPRLCVDGRLTAT